TPVTGEPTPTPAENIPPVAETQASPAGAYGEPMPTTPPPPPAGEGGPTASYPAPSDLNAGYQQPLVSDQGAGTLPPDQGYAGPSEYEMPAPSSSGGGLKIILIVVGVIVFGLIIGLVFVLTRKPAQKTATQPVQTEQPAQPQIEFNKEITVPAGYVSIESDCYKTVVIKDNDVKDTGEFCAMKGTYGAKKLSTLKIESGTDTVDLDTITVDSFNKQQIIIVAAGIEKTKFSEMDAVKITGVDSTTVPGQKIKTTQYIVLAPPDRYKNKDNQPIKSFTITGSVNDAFSQGGLDNLVNNWTWK
ncbi:MAG: hypothetical protein Q8P54_02680, partial [bacterium]|nr:hypothetical protein [bacterium]